jgi:U3 small nucleolar RNA-associated protein 12
VGPTLLVSGSKDTLLKVWDLETQHCIQTVLGHRSEVWALDVNPKETRLVSGAADAKLRVWALDLEGKGRSAGEIEGLAGGTPVASEQGPCASVGSTATASPVFVSLFGAIPRPAHGAGSARALGVEYSADGRFVALCGAGKAVELFRVRSDVEARRKMARRMKRQREKERSRLAVS